MTEQLQEGQTEGGDVAKTEVLKPKPDAEFWREVRRILSAKMGEVSDG